MKIKIQDLQDQPDRYEDLIVTVFDKTGFARTGRYSTQRHPTTQQVPPPESFWLVTGNNHVHHCRFQDLANVVSDAQSSVIYSKDKRSTWSTTSYLEGQPREHSREHHENLLRHEIDEQEELRARLETDR